MEAENFPSLNTARQNQQTIYHRDDIIQVTNKFIRIYGRTYSLHHVVSVTPHKVDPEYVRNIIIWIFVCGFIAGFIAFVVSYSNRNLADIVIVVGIALGLVIGILMSKASYVLRLSFSSGEIEKLHVRNEIYVRQVAGYIIRAMNESP